MYAGVLKPLSDRVGALLLILVFSPFILLTALAVRIGVGKPLFFVQERPGLQGKLFRIYKFRTMTNERDENGELLPDERRLHGAGKIIRSLSLDELPQLFNVLKGEMSFIGPRPLLVEYLPLYNNEQQKRHDVKPGITGWAQVNGRNAIDWKTRFELDLYYVRHLSFALDVKIAWLTVKKVFLREGVSAEGHVTMEKFNGNN